MGRVILGVTTSLDGFAEDRNGSVGALYPDLDILQNTEIMREAMLTTGEVVMAWRNLQWQKIRTGTQVVTSSKFRYSFLQINFRKGIRKKLTS
ncbi:hypothetical protein A2634_05480 [Candidatus Amesbacteria bacterium RIFCSPHIGHO2_01_FULL_48_32]|uniref:Uncharacterized protein n=2 Tax=Microgenomates group TaxID=1794810 RepID=A0A1F4ZA28_9BACT|nr:MAG: Bifunctional deaminase-reductase domain protein [Candidatus Woesebacteria bacterium GW2011_GWB1_38_5b]OGC97839.1 MAG: hypothetical protein A2634_05480 [Candidatus Amesbacteria bacterium RIFCSPHIGHO2_01_FULL_48_32]OGD03152.1 MAG: hypothetical protein A2989_02335 [Candidatus Amesbacteria bacterium RIFCSPLOWO2_01_FULL_48_25]